MKPSPRTRNFHMNLFFICFFFCINDIKIQEYRNNTLNSPSATSMLLKSVSIPPAFFFFFQFSCQFSREKVVTISNCPFVSFEINSFNLVQVFGDLFPFLSSRNCALLFQWRDQQPWFPGTTSGFEETPHYHWLFPRQMTTEKRAQKFHSDDASLPRSG